MHIAIVSLPAKSHLNAMVALGARLRARGHDVTLISLHHVEPAVTTAELRFLPLAVKSWTDAWQRQALDVLSRMSGEVALRAVIDATAAITDSWLLRLDGLLRAGGFDGAIFDDAQPYIALPAMRLHMQYATVACAAHIDLSGETPLCFADWPSHDTAAARARNAAGIRHLSVLLAAARRAGQSYAREAGLGLDLTDPSAARSKTAWITQMPRCFDFEQPGCPPGLIHCGPFRDHRFLPCMPFPWDRLSDLPLVYASMGTLMTGLAGVFAAIIDVARRRPHLQFAVSAGATLDLRLFEPLPRNVVLVPFAPQIDLLKRAVLCITHGGLNTVLEALAEGVPLVAIPVTFDQPGVGARIREKRVGEVVLLAQLSAESLGMAVDRVLDDGRYRENARRQRDGIAAADGLNRAASAIEKAFAGAPP